MELTQPAIKKIVVIGPESTGKSTLCRLLADHFQTRWCPEYAREYLLRHGSQYQFPDLLTIAHGQLALEDQVASEVAAQPGSSPFLFIDTDMHVMKVWCEYVFNDCHRWILDQIVFRRYDLYLLCRPDLPWVKDELREYPDEKPRQELFHIYKAQMVAQAVPWAEISGEEDQRLKQAISAVERIMQTA